METRLGLGLYILDSGSGNQVRVIFIIFICIFRSILNFQKINCPTIHTNSN